MTKPFAGPFGLSLRDFLLLSMIAISMALSACMTSQEKEKVERHKAEMISRIERAQKEEEEKKAADEAALADWKSKNEAYLRRLCASDPGAEHQFAWDSYHIAVSTDSPHTDEARKARRPVIDCEGFRIQKPSAFNADAFIERLKAENKALVEWLASPEGKAYQRNLCSLSGDERRRALENAAQLYGLLPRDQVSDEAKAREHGFTPLDCPEERTSALGFTWSNVVATI